MNSIKPAYKNLKELRFILCPTCDTSLGLRAYLNSNYSKLKNNKEQAQFLIRECSNVESVVLARYCIFLN